MNYMNKLPRAGIPVIKCQSINEDGNRCRHRARYEVWAHLDSELYDGSQCISFYLCEDHFQINAFLYGEVK